MGVVVYPEPPRRAVRNAPTGVIKIAPVLRNKNVVAVKEVVVDYASLTVGAVVRVSDSSRLRVSAA